MADIHTPDINWNYDLKLYTNNFINQLKIYSLDADFAHLWNPICPLFEQKLSPIEWHQFAPICRNVRMLTEALINLNKEDIGINNYTNILDLYCHILATLDRTNAVIPRIGFKSARRSFPISVRLLNNFTDITKVVKIDEVHILKHHDIAPTTLDNLIERLDTFYTLVYGKSMGKRITKIWASASFVTTIYVENACNDIIGLTTIIYMTVNNYKIAYISGLAVHPELTRTGLGDEMINILLSDIVLDANTTNIDSIVFGIEDGNSNMNGFITNYRSKLVNQIKQPNIETLRGKSMFLPVEVTIYWVAFEDRTTPLPTIEEIDNALLEAAKLATHECGKTNFNFYMLAGSHFVRQWFHSTILGQYIQQL